MSNNKASLIRDIEKVKPELSQKLGIGSSRYVASLSDEAGTPIITRVLINTTGCEVTIEGANGDYTITFNKEVFISDGYGPRFHFTISTYNNDSATAQMVFTGNTITNTEFRLVCLNTANGSSTSDSFGGTTTISFEFF